MRVPFYNHSGAQILDSSAPEEVRERFLELLLWSEENHALIKHFFRRLPRDKYAYDRDFIIQTHTAHAARKAAESWSKKKKLALVDWFRLKLNFEVKDALRILVRYNQREGVQSLDEMEVEDGIEHRREINAIAVCEDITDRLIEEMDIQELFDETLEGRDRVMVQLAYEGWTLLKIGEIYGLSESRVSQLLKDARQKVAEYIREKRWYERTERKRASGGTSKKPSGTFKSEA